MIAQGRMQAAGMAKITAARESGRWDTAYTDRTAIDAPADLLEALAADPEAEHNFVAFATSYRNMLVRYVNGAKRTVTRRKRIEEVTRRASTNIRSRQEPRG